jgi:hypothetical protein
MASTQLVFVHFASPVFWGANLKLAKDAFGVLEVLLCSLHHFEKGFTTCPQGGFELRGVNLSQVPHQFLNDGPALVTFGAVIHAPIIAGGT